MIPLPRSLAARITWLVASVGLLSFVLHLVVLSLWMDPFSEDLTSAIAGRVILTRDAISQAPHARQNQLAASLQSDHFEVRRHSSPESLNDPDSAIPLPPLIGSRLRRKLGPEFRLSLDTLDTPLMPKRGVLLFDFRIANESWRIKYDLQPPTRAIVSTGLGWLILLAVAVFASLAVGLRGITKPFSSVAHALAQQTGPLQPLPIPPSAGSELATVITSFNSLVDTVRTADITKHNLLAGVSHDLRTPLARLRLRIEMECEDHVAEPLLLDIDAIDRIVAQFMAYAQNNASAKPGNSDVASAVIAHTVLGYVQRGFDVRFEHDRACAVELQDIALQRVLTNLIDNALAYGASPIEVSLYQPLEQDSDSCLVLTVWDSGRGMSDSQFERARLPFVRLSDNEPNIGHCGLGLAIVDQLAQQLGASLALRRDSGGRFGVAVLWSRQLDANG